MWSEFSGMDGWREPADARMWTHGIVVVTPLLEREASLRQRAEQRLVQELVAQPAIEALDEGVLHRFAGRNVVPFDPGLVGPGQDGVARQFGAVVTDNRLGLAAPGDQTIELAGDPPAR